jgi:hypothetical protein
MHEDVWDPPTGLWSRFGLVFFAEHYLKLLRRMGREAVLYGLALEGVPPEGPSEPAQEARLREAATLLRRTFRTSDAVARIAPDRFAVLLPEASPLAAEALRFRLEDRLAEWRTEHAGEPPLLFRLVMDRVRPDREPTFLGVLTRIEAALRSRQPA